MSSRFTKLRMVLRARAIDSLSRVMYWADAKLVPSQRWAKVINQRDRLYAAVLAQSVPVPASEPLHGIVFSMNRPLQLDGLLNSYFHLVEKPAPITVLFRATSPEYARAYEQVGAAFAIQGARLIREQNFRTDLLELLANLPAARLFFLTDDDIFINQFDMSTLCQVDTARAVVSLRLGFNLDYCYTQSQLQPVPPHSDGPDGLTSWTWRDGKLDWHYPMSVDGHIYGRDEILLMARVSDFNAPNTFEAALGLFETLFMGRKGLCFAQSRLVNIPANKVQTENANFAGNTDADWLLEQWNIGYRLDWPRLTGFHNRSAHQEVELPLILRG